MSVTRPTRLIRARDLVRNNVLLRECSLGENLCHTNPGIHKIVKSPIAHELLINDFEIHDDELTAIAVSEIGEQVPISYSGWSIVRVYAD